MADFLLPIFKVPNYIIFTCRWQIIFLVMNPESWSLQKVGDQPLNGISLEDSWQFQVFLPHFSEAIGILPEVPLTHWQVSDTPARLMLTLRATHFKNRSTDRNNALKCPIMHPLKRQNWGKLYKLFWHFACRLIISRSILHWTSQVLFSI